MKQAFEFADIHSHILPGVDDGAVNIEESLSMLEEADRVGIKKIILTPHVPVDGNGTEMLDKISRQFDTLLKRAYEREMAIDLYLGAELLLQPELALKIKKDKRLTMGGMGKYALIEMPSLEIPMYASKVFFDLLMQGVIPIWAHPERCCEVMDDYRAVHHYRDNGVLLQINAGSLLGFYGKRVKQAATALTKETLGHILASDIHRVGDIKTLLPEGSLYLAKIVGEAKALEMVMSNPAKVVNGL